ncbi:MAG: hypothetical protein AAGK14_08685 [Verrucomicrobiota bacterium]
MSHQHPILLFELVGVALALSKALQVVLPLLAFVLLRDLPFTRWFLEWLVRREAPEADSFEQREILGRYERQLGRAVGFISWKIGCDLGFFIIASNSLWQAFTLAGLIPYTIVQYAIYRLFGQKLLLAGMANPFAEESYETPSLVRRKPVRRALARWLHEDLNATSPHVPMRRVILKPFVDFGAVVLSWSLYTMGIFWVESGEWNYAPLWEFQVWAMLGMYLGSVLMFIVGFNLGAGLYTLLARTLGEWFWRQPAWEAASASGWHGFFRRLRRPLRWRLHRFMDKHGINVRWLTGITAGIVVVGYLAKPLAEVVHDSGLSMEYALWPPKESQLARQQEQANGAMDMTKEAPDFVPLMRRYLELRNAKPEAQP